MSYSLTLSGGTKEITISIPGSISEDELRERQRVADDRFVQRAPATVRRVHGKWITK